MKDFLKNHQVLGIMLSVLASVFLVALVSYSATTISTNITTAGYASSTVSLNTQGNLWVGGHATTSGNLYVNGYATTTSLTVGTSTTQIKGLLFGTCAINPGNINAEATSTASCTATGVSPGWRVFLTPPALEKYIIFNGASSTAANTILVQLSNATGTTVTTVSRTWDWFAIK